MTFPSRWGAALKPALAQALEAVIGVGHSLQRVDRYRRLGAALGLGALSATAMAPYYFLPGLVLGLSGLLLLIDSTLEARLPRRAAFLTGWAFGFGYFLAGMYWVGFAFLVQADEFAWMIPIAVPGLMAFLGLFVAVPVWIVSFWWRDGIERALLLIAAIAVSEFIRGHVLTGLPWNLTGQAFAGTALLSQLAAWVGPYGLSLVVLMMCVLPGAAWPISGGSRSWWGLPVYLALGTLAFVLLFGSARLALLGDVKDTDITIAVMQPNVPQRDKMDPRKNDEHFRKLITATQAALPKDGTSIILWPENVYPYLAQAEDASSYFGEVFPKDAHIIAGTYRSFEDGDLTRFANSVVAFGGTAEDGKPITGLYDKHHLVPFGEYLPFKGLLKALHLSQLAPVEDGFTPGSGPAVLTVAGTTVAPLICYEDVFPGALYPHRERPTWLAVVTNDAWFGDNAGPKQHLDIARLRAIESGLPMARSANTGISAFIDPLGRKIDKIQLYQNGSIVHRLPEPLATTIYDRLGNLPFMCVLVVMFGWAIRGLASLG